MPSLSLVIPAYNESHRLPATFRSIAKYLGGAQFERTELLVVDDGSTDRTAECAWRERPILERAGATLRILSNPGNRGKGYSVRRGMREAQHEWVLFCDADLSAPIEEIGKLLEASAAGGHQVAIGSRALDRSLIGVRQPQYRELFGRVFNIWVRGLTGLNIADTQCGFKLFTREAAREIAAKQRLERFGFDVEQLYLARKLGFTVAEVPVRWNNASDSSVRWADGLAAFADVWKVKCNDWAKRYS